MLIGKKRIQANTGRSGRIEVGRANLEAVAVDGRVDMWLDRRRVLIGPDQRGVFLGSFRIQNGRVVVPAEAIAMGTLGIGRWTRIDMEDGVIVLRDMGGGQKGGNGV